MFDARKGQITITRGDTGLLAIVPTGYVPTSRTLKLVSMSWAMSATTKRITRHSAFSSRVSGWEEFSRKHQ